MLSVIVGAIFTLATIALTIGAYLLMRLLMGGDPEGQQKDLAGSIIFRVSALHGLILALVFAQEMIVYQQLKYEGAVEANAIADVFFDADRYRDGQTKPIHNILYKYVTTVVEKEWPKLGETGRLDSEAWLYWDQAYNIVLDIKPATTRQESLRDNMLRDIHQVSESRVKRENHASNTMSLMFWFAAIAGVILIALGYYSYPPVKHNLILISIFGAFTGIVLFFIYSFADPYGDPGALSPGAHERLKDQMERSGLLGEPFN